MLKTKIKKLPGMLLFAGLVSLALNGSAKAAPAASPLFQGDSILDVTLKADLPTLINDRSKNYHPASITVVDPAVRGSEIQLKVGTRGMTSLRSCEFPHFRFKFDTNQTKGTLMSGLDKVKIVAHCDNPDLGNDYSNEQKEVLIQYALYKTYNLFTDYSIKVRLAKFHYVDTSGQMEPFTKYAFFVEPTESVAARNGAKPRDRDEINDSGYSTAMLNMDYAGLDEVFEFFVGNGDWRLMEGGEISTLNAEMVSGENIKFLPMPYDLDRSGMCNNQFAYHSIYDPGHTFPIVGDSVDTIRSIYNQNYRGRQMYKMAFSRLREKREQMYGVFNSLSGIIDAHYRDRTIGHMDRFFEAIGTKDTDADNL